MLRDVDDYSRSGRATEGMVRWVAASVGTVVPSTAMSLREPPWGLGSVDIVVVIVFGDVKRGVGIFIRGLLI